MNMMSMNAESLGKAVGEIVPEIYVVIAKNAVAGLDEIGIAELLGSTREEVVEITSTQVYKDVRLLLSSEYAKEQVDRDFNWDSLESQALKNLSKRMHLENDPEFNLRVAVMANKAQRRLATGPKVLDPSQGTMKVPLSLTSRIVQRLNTKTGEASREETHTVSLTDGTAVNPKFEDIDKLFGVSARPMVAANATTRTSEVDFDVDQLAADWIAGKTV